MVENSDYRQGVVAVIYRDNRYVLIEKPEGPDDWYFPAGGMEDGETTEETFYREMNEELELKPEKLASINLTGLNHQYEWSDEMKERTGFVGQEQRIVLAELKQDAELSVEDTDELSDYKFVDYENLISALAFNNVERMVKRLQDENLLPASN